MGRATVTVLFTDLVGSTELRSQLGDRAAEALRREHDRLLTEAVERHGGRVVKGLGDGIMATFAGASEAVSAAVTIQQAIDRFSRSGKAPAPLAVRVGLSVGDVTVEDDDVHGIAVIEAARLCDAASGGEILGPEVLTWLTRGEGDHGFHPIGKRELKGLADPVPVVRVEWEPARASTIPMPQLLTDLGRIFVGRDAEVERLEELWKEAAAGERRIAVLAGEPGVGKTRLAGEFALRVHEQGGLVLAGRCDEDLGVPYQPFVEALRHVVDHAPPEDLPGRLGRYGGELTRLVPELTDRLEGLPPPLRSDAETERYRLFDAVAAWLAAASAEDPVLLVLDDLQWATKPTLLLLRHVSRSPEPLRLLIVGTFRDSELPPGHPLPELLAELRRQDSVERLAVTGLDRAAVGQYVEAAAGHALDDEVRDLALAVHTETAGNPFFVGQVLRHLTETGGVALTDGRWTTTVAVGEIGIPEGVREVVARRLSRLSEATNQLLRLAAVAGPEFEVGVLAAAAGLTDDAVLDALEQALAARLLIDAPGPVPRNRFAHALVRAAVYDELPAARRAALHRRVGEAIETVHGRDLAEHLSALARHFTASGDQAKAAGYWHGAGRRALARLAPDEAVACLAQALTGSDEGQRLEVLIDLGDAQRQASDPEHRTTLLDAGREARRRGDSAALARAAIAISFAGSFSVLGDPDQERVSLLESALTALEDRDPATRARLLARLGLELIFSDDSARKVEMSREALSLARHHGDPATLAEVINACWVATWTATNLPERLAASEELIALTEELGDPALRGWALFRGAIAALESGNVDATDTCLALLETLNTELRQPAVRWFTSLFQVPRLCAAGRLEEAERAAAASLAVGEALQRPEGEAFHAIHMVIIRFEQGRLPELESELRRMAEWFPLHFTYRAMLAVAYWEAGQEGRARTAFDEIAADGFANIPDFTANIRLMTSAFCAEVCAHLGDRQRAKELHALLAPHAGQVVAQTVAALGSVSHYLGMLATTLGRYDEAEERFVAAAALHERMRAPGWLARTRLEWARMLLARREPGDADRAGELLVLALDTARQLGQGGVERDAIALTRTR
jgi:class 3 adenylate cyclase/tetratricopeptide (TPR) repeat protein